MIDRDDWLPVGSVVRLEEGERPIMVAGFMAQDGNTGRYWDYVGYPYPEGDQGKGEWSFDKDMVAEVRLIGYLDGMGCLFSEYLDDKTGEFEQIKAVSGR